MRNPTPALSRRRLRRVLGLSEDATRNRIEAATARLVNGLQRRLASADAAEIEAIRKEIANLEASCARYAVHPDSDSADRDRNRRRRRNTFGIAALTLALLVAYAAGFRITRLHDEKSPVPAVQPARLLLEGALPGATLRIFDSDREELLLMVAAHGASIDLNSGRYALDVRREDCSDRWTRSVYFADGSTHRFEPIVCVGEGKLTVRSNVSRDRLRIDGFDLGATGDAPHLLGVGDHEIRVEKAGYIPFLGQIRIRKGDELTLRAELVALPNAGPEIGRPLPVERISPTKAPSELFGPEPIESPNLSEAFRSAGQRLDLRRPDLLNTSINATSAGSTPWHDRISAELLKRFDLDASGQIDRLEESSAIPCRVWLAVESDFDDGRMGLSMVRYYGFDGTEWHPKALGVAEAHRDIVFKEMKKCGLRS